jgi:hypothetical protein
MNERRRLIIIRIGLILGVSFAVLAGYGVVKNAGPRAEVKAAVEAERNK